MSSPVVRAARALAVLLALAAGLQVVGTAPAGADGPLILTPAHARSGEAFTIGGTCAANEPVQARFVDAGAGTLRVKNGSGSSGPTGTFSFNATVADEGD